MTWKYFGVNLVICLFSSGFYRFLNHKRIFLSPNWSSYIEYGVLESVLNCECILLWCSVVGNCFCSHRPCLRSSCCDCSCIGQLLSLHYSIVFLIFWFVCASWCGLLAWSGLWTSALAGLRGADSPVCNNQVGDPWTSFQKTGISAWCSKASITAVSSCPEVRIAMLLYSSVLGPLPEQLIQ